MKLPILVFSRLVHPKTFEREIIGREERSWCNDGKTVSGWEGGGSWAAEEVASLPASQHEPNLAF